MPIGCAPAIKVPKFQPIISPDLSFFPEPGPILRLDYSNGQRSLRIEIQNRLAFYNRTPIQPNRIIFSESDISVPFWNAKANWEFQLSPCGPNDFLLHVSDGRWWIARINSGHCSFIADAQLELHKTFPVTDGAEIVGVTSHHLVYWFPNDPQFLFIQSVGLSDKPLKFKLPKRMGGINAVQEIQDSNNLLLRLWCHTGGLLPLFPGTPATAFIEIGKLQN
ncbi:hypothetical protein [Geothrix rubra]|uniref:hypothetical protein n=1 Tax=Geothrix rubra TaxID=2927977 RepID=UPI0025564606|nr:hypothetical protein [Geothrix rubra]